MSHIFISYSKKDITFARHLRGLLETEGFQVWIDESRIIPHAEWWDTIVHNIDTCAAFIVIMSPNSEPSEYVELEVLRAKKKNKLIFPVLFKGEEFSILANRQYADMRDGTAATLPALLLAGLKSVAPVHPPTPPPAPLPGAVMGDERDAPDELSSRPPPLPPEKPIAAPPATAKPVKLPRNFVPALAGVIGILALIAAIGVISRIVANTSTTTPDPNATGIPTQPPIGQQFTDNSGVEMVFVPRGKFLMGSDPAKDSSARDDELPQSEITIDHDFWIDLTEVTNSAYKKFVDANGYAQDKWWTQAGLEWKGDTKAPKDYAFFTGGDQPRVGVSWYEAYAFCAWRGARLPTEAEWEYAARGQKGQVYPWGDKFDRTLVVYSPNANNRTATVGSKPDGKSWVGSLDMVGNVWEWVNTIYDQQKFPYPYKADGRDDVEGNMPRVLRGSAWDYDSAADMRVAFRIGYDPGVENNTAGFRCARTR